jgi:sensor histidine kinase YesM
VTRKGFFHSRSIFAQLLLFSLLISLVPVLIIGGFLYKKMDDMVADEMADYHAQITSQYMKNVEEKLLQYEKSLTFISNNTLISKSLTNINDGAYDRGKVISEEVTKSLLLEKLSEVRNCMVYSLAEENPVYGRRATMIEEGRREGWYDKEQQNMDENWFSYFASDDQQPLLSRVKRIESLNTSQFTRKDLGFVKLDLYIDRLFAPAELSEGGTASYDVIVYDHNSKVLYSTSKDIAKYPAQVSTYVVNDKNMDSYGLKIRFLFDNQELIATGPVMILLILLLIGCSYLYSRGFSSRLGVLLSKVRTVETGDLTIQDPVEGTDEIAALDRQFDHMLIKLNELIQKTYVQELENKETQLRNLQLQINPHFLYNTLETISSIAAVKQAFEICEICEKLGGIFRYSLGKDYGEFVTLEQELTHVKNYIFIQKTRYGSRFEVYYNIEPDTESHCVLRFILQPIVENAIVHGMSEFETSGTVEISAYEKDNVLYISIVDDGVGMDNSKIEELMEYINSDKTDIHDKKKSIGIRNVNQRIKFSCGNQYGIIIKSHPGEGSRFLLKLPVIRGGVKDET